MTLSRPRIAVAIPVKNEADCIGPCFRALVNQVGAQIDHIVLLLNNCTDGSATGVRRLSAPAGTTIHAIERVLAPEFANAGHARRLAMNEAACLLGPGDILMTTGADGQVDPDWVAASLAVFAQGVDVVAGQAELHPADWSRIPLRLHEDDARECAYDALLDAIHARLDPDPFDPEPRHTQHSGASIAVRMEFFRQCGGVPPVASGEDRALVAALRAIDARIRHAPEVRVVVSGRTVGRASGGMADTIRRRLDQPDEFLDDRLEPAADCARRAQARAGLRLVHAGAMDPALLAAKFKLPQSTFYPRWTTSISDRLGRHLSKLLRDSGARACQLSISRPKWRVRERFWLARTVKRRTATLGPQAQDGC